MNEAEMLIACSHCGNKANCHVRTQYTQHIESEDNDHFITTWSILECSACNHLILQQTYMDSTWGGPEDNDILYPVPKKLPTFTDNIPINIRKEYEEALKVQSISSNACTVLARRTLEAIVHYENAVGDTLEKKINSLLQSERIPHLLADVAHLERKIGNLGAHVDKKDVTEAEVAIMLEFLKIISNYSGPL